MVADGSKGFDFLGRDFMNEINPKKLSDYIPEFYFDIIARLVPGGLTCIIYGWQSLGTLGSAFSILIGLVVSYFLGILLDVVSDLVLGRLVFRWFISALKKFVRLYTFMPDNELWLLIRQLPEKQVIIFNKMMAEKAMLRSAILVNIIAFFYPPSLIPAHRTLLVCFISLIVLLLCHFMLQLYVSERIRNSKTKTE
jgi:hypothetical protein